MGIVIQFPRHRHRAAPTGSAGSIRHKSGDADNSRPSRAFDKTKYVSGGKKPRARQFETACGERPTSRATDDGPPKALTTSSKVSSGLRSGIDMDGNLYTSRVSGKSIHLVCSPVESVSAQSVAMAKRPTHPRSLEAVRARLIALRMAIGPNQRQFAKRAGIGANTWSNFENEDRRISIEEAFKLVDTYGVSLDWIYEGRGAGLMPGPLLDKIREAEAEAAEKAAAA